MVSVRLTNGSAGYESSHTPNVGVETGWSGGSASVSYRNVPEMGCPTRLVAASKTDSAFVLSVMVPLNEPVTTTARAGETVASTNRTRRTLVQRIIAPP